MKTYFRLAVLLLALGFMVLPSGQVSGSSEPKKIGATHPSAQQNIASKLVPAAATFTVNSTGDTPDATPGDGACNDGTGNCTLRAAIMQANATGGGDTINFDISGPKTITPTSPLPVITDTVIINGTSQSGFSGTPIIELKGSTIGASVILAITASNCVIRGLVLNSLDGDAIRLLGDGNRIVGNFIGTDLSGAATGPGVAQAGILIQGNSNIIGGIGAGDANVIAFNARGVSVSTGFNNLILANSIFSNLQLGIDLNNDQVTTNDLCDGDNGPNGLQNYPNLTAAQSNGSVVAIQGTLNSVAGKSCQVDFYANSACDPSGFGEGETFIGSAIVTTDPLCNAALSVSFPVSVAPGQFITATATDTSLNTSEFSQCVPVASAGCLITCPPSLTRNTDPGQCGAVVTYPPPETSGPCGEPTTCNPDSGSFFLKGTTNVTCSTITLTTCSFDITVVDNTPPRITCPADMIVPTDPGMGVAVVNYAFAAFSDNCPGATAVCLPPSGTVFPLGVSTVACSANDVAGNTAVCSFTITVSDTEAPLIKCPVPVANVPPSGQTSAVVNYPPPTVSDNLPGATVVCVPASGSSFPLGTTTVNCTAADARGNKASCSFIVTVGGPQAKVTIPGNKAAIEFATVPPARKPPKSKKNPCTLFTIENTGFAPLVLTLDSFKRSGTDVTNGRITDPNDLNPVAEVPATKFFVLFLVNSDQSLTALNVGSMLTLQPGQAQTLCAKFGALIPGLAGKTTGLAASDVLPDVVTSTITFRQNAGANIAIPLIARVATGVVLIDPANPRRPPSVTFTRSGNDITVSYAVFDSNLDVSRAKYEFLDANGQVVAGPFEIDLAEPLRALNLVRGQSFSVEQRFTGASSSPEITAVRLTVFDGETIAIGSSSASATPISASSIQLMKRARGVTLYPSDVKIEPQFPR